MQKPKKPTPEMTARHHARLNIAVIGHVADLKETIGHLQKKDLRRGTRSLDRAVKRLERVVFQNAKELGYKIPPKKKRQRLVRRRLLGRR